MSDLLLPSIVIAVAFFVQTTCGFGAGLISIPLLLGVMSLKDASGFLAIYFGIFSLIMFAKVWRDMDKRVLLELGASGTVGMLLGVLMLDKFGDMELLPRILGVFILVYVALTYLRKSELTVLNRLGVLFGFSGGFFSGLFSAGGQFYVIYANSKVRKIEALRATIIGSLAIGNFTRIPFHLGTDIINMEVAKMALICMPAFAIGMLAGQLFYNRINKRLVKELIMGLLFVAGVKLIVG